MALFLLRFSCYYLAKPEIESRLGVDEWEQMDDASYCTRLTIGTPVQILARAAAIILEAIEDVLYKKRLEELSWLCPEDFENKSP